MKMQGRVPLDLSEVTLMDRTAARFFAGRLQPGVALVNCPFYLEPGILRETTHERSREDCTTVAFDFIPDCDDTVCLFREQLHGGPYVSTALCSRSTDIQRGAARELQRSAGLEAGETERHNHSR